MKEALISLLQNLQFLAPLPSLKTIFACYALHLQEEYKGMPRTAAAPAVRGVLAF